MINMLNYYFFDTNVVLGFVFKHDYLHSNAKYYFKKENLVWSKTVYEAINKIEEYCDVYSFLLMDFKILVRSSNFDEFNYYKFNNLYSKINLDIINKDYSVDTSREIITYKNFKDFKLFFFLEWIY